MASKLSFVIIPLLLASCAGLPAAGTAREQKLVRTRASSVIAARQAAMHMSATLMVRGIRAALKSGSDIRDQEAAAEGLAKWAGAIPGMFPVGSAAPNSRALPAIWTNKADFDAHARDYQQAALVLRDFARAGDRAGVTKQVEIVQSKCAACHQRYRAK
jgi:cytochrome c556